jgi:hypothetical protein
MLPMRFLHWLVHELTAVLIATLYFGTCFLLVMVLKKLMLEEYGIAFGDYVSVVLLALVTAKVVVVFDRVSFGRHLGLTEVALRTTIYTLAALVLLLIEHAASTRAEAGGFGAALTGAFQHPDAPRIWATLICVALAFAAYCGFAVLRRELGTTRLVAVFLDPPRPDAVAAGGGSGA